MKCHNCGREIGDFTAFCTYCGVSTGNQPAESSQITDPGKTDEPAETLPGYSEPFEQTGREAPPPLYNVNRQENPQIDLIPEHNRTQTTFVPDYEDEYMNGTSWPEISRMGHIIGVNGRFCTIKWLKINMYFLLFAVFQGEIKYVFLAVICALLGLRDQNFYVLHLLPANYNWAVAYRFLVLMITLQPCFLLLLLQSLYEKLAKPIVVRCYAVLYAVLAAAHFILPTQDIAPLSRIGYYLSMPFFLYLVVQLIRRFWRIRRLERDDVLVLLGYLLLFGSNVYEAVFGRIVTTITRHGAAPPYLLVFVFLIAGAISLKINRREQELSESRRQREVLTQLNRLKSEFLHQMAHELKTPLTVMSGYAQLTDWQLSTGAVSADAHEHLQTISSEAQRLSALVSRLIDLANGGSPDIEMGVIDAAQLLSGAADVCRPMLEKKHNRLESDSGEGITLWGNTEMLLQVLINLTVNANRHTENGVIAYRITDEGERVCLRVSDTGSGIAPDLLPHIFEKGCSGDGGSGIGLTICADAMKIHHGLLEVEHTDADGTVFRLELPKKPLKTQGENDCGR